MLGDCSNKVDCGEEFMNKVWRPHKAITYHFLILPIYGRNTNPMKQSLIFLILFTSLTFVSSGFAEKSYFDGDTLIVGYYGRPGAESLGVLGQHSVEELMPLIKAKAGGYAKLTGKKAIPAFHLIYGLATSDPGSDKDFIYPLSDHKVMEYINAAQDNEFAVIIDLQLGGMPPQQAVQSVLKYLQYDNVHLAIDPEFEVNGLDVPPGKVIGHITGEEINMVQSAMRDYLTKNDIQENKILIVHMFRKSMVSHKDVVKKYGNIDLIMNLDGHGSPQLKVKIYNSLYTEKAASNVSGGLKLFFNEDKPVMLTPRQVMGMEDIGNARILEPPIYINFQ